jgi:hypothetical protein
MHRARVLVSVEEPHTHILCHLLWFTPSCLHFFFAHPQVLLDSVILRALPAIVFSAAFYWLMGLRATANAFITFTAVFVTYNGLVRAHASPTLHGCARGCGLQPRYLATRYFLGREGGGQATRGRTAGLPPLLVKRGVLKQRAPSALSPTPLVRWARWRCSAPASHLLPAEPSWRSMCCS